MGRDRVLIARVGGLSVYTKRGLLGDVGQGGGRIRRRGRRPSAASNGIDHNNRLNDSRLIRVRCRSARSRLFLPDHHRFRLSLTLGSSVERVRSHQKGGYPLIPDSLPIPIHRGRPIRNWRRDHGRPNDGCRDRAWMRRNGRGLASESRNGIRRGDTDPFLFYFLQLFFRFCSRVVFLSFHCLVFVTLAVYKSWSSTIFSSYYPQN